MLHRSLPNALATAILAGEATAEGIVERIARTLGQRKRWVPAFAKRYLKAYQGETRPRRNEVVRFLLADTGFVRFQRRLSEQPSRLAVASWLTEPQQMQPVPAASNWKIPSIVSVAGLAAWFRLGFEDLNWLADLRGLARLGKQSSKLDHYNYNVLAKPSGGLRLIEAPRLRLRHLQRAILIGILNQVPAHAAVHGFCHGRSIKTFAQPHTGKQVLLRMDLQNFFPSISGARIQTFFRTLGYPESVADLLGGICTNATPRGVWKSASNAAVSRETRDLYARPHLPQGAPTSPSLANLCFYRADCRLAGLAKSAGATYTRYADDLAFSGGKKFDRSSERFAAHVAAILREEGFTVNHHKTRIMRQGVRQHLAGLTANQSVNVKREDVDCLKAILTNCIRHGADSQNREGRPSFRSHLEGRVAFVESINAEKGKRLRAILTRIEWE
jgi:RNA-directed DNA polymerase